MKTIFKFLIAILLFSIATVYADTIRVFTPLESVNRALKVPISDIHIDHEGIVPIGVNQHFVVGYDPVYDPDYVKFYKIPIGDIDIGWSDSTVPIGVNEHFVVGDDHEYGKFYKIPIGDIDIGWSVSTVPIGVNEHFVVGDDREYGKFCKVPID